MENPQKVKLLVSMAGPDVSHNAGDEIDVDDATAKRFIERNIAEPIASRPAKETAEKKPRVSVRLWYSDPADGLGMEETIHPQGSYVREKRT